MKHPDRFTASVPLRPTRHYVERASLRCLRENVRDFVLQHGVELRAAGATHVVVIERQLPAELRGTEAARRAHDWIIVVGDDGALLTCYRRKRAVRFVRRKSGQPSARSRGGQRRAGSERARHQGRGAAC